MRQVLRWPNDKMSLLAVLDTNVVLDWFVFRNPGVASLADAIESGALTWLSCDDMRNELAHVLVNAPLAGRRVDPITVLASATRWMREAPTPPTARVVRLRCTDASDQMFIDLALAQRADWLITRDRALLKLSGRARALGLNIVTPERWHALTAAIHTDAAAIRAIEPRSSSARQAEPGGN